MLSENARKIVESRYFLEGEETEWGQLATRVASDISNGEKLYAEPFAEMIHDMKFIPGGRIRRNAGRIRGSLFICYHLPIGDSIDEIGDCAANALKLWSDGGGVGINFSSLRPSGAAIKGLGGRSSGLVSFMRAIDGLAACIESGGSRRAASLGSCDVSHPEIESFIDAKLVDGSISYFNVSVNITKAFLEAVMQGVEWPLTFRGMQYNKVDARYLWQKILSNMIASAEPGLLVWDNLIKNNSYYFAHITGCNPSLRSGTRVLTAEGIVPIEQIETKQNGVVNLDGQLSEATCFQSGINKTLFEVVLQGGYSYYATAEHKWPIIKYDGFPHKYVTKVATSDLNPGDYLPRPSFKTSLPFGTEGTYEDGFVIGWNLGDGWITERKAGKQIGFITSLEDQTFGINTIISTYLKRTGWSGEFDKLEINVNHQPLRDVFIQFGVVNKKEGLPTTIWTTASEEFRKGLIDGLFSSDGCFSRYPSIDTAYKKLAIDVADLLGFYGFNVDFSYRQCKASFPNGKEYNKLYDRYTLRIRTASSINHFHSIFKLTHGRKQQQLNNIVSKFKLIPPDRGIKIKDIIRTPLQEDVWDISVQDSTHCFELGHCVTGNCGEATLAPFDVCDLGSLVLSNFVDSGGRTKWSDLETTVELAIRFLDNVIDVNKYRLESNRRMASTGRRVGLGVMGLAEYLFAKKVRYGSPQAISAVEDLMRAIRDYAYSASIRLAVEKGSFPAFDKIHYHKASFIRKLQVSLRKDITDYGIRNVTVLALAPTGTISLIPEVTNSIEPLFSKAYKRKDRVGERVYIHPLTTQLDPFPDWFVSTEDLDPEDHLNVQVACQKYVDGAVSKTINLPSDYTVDKLSNVLFEYLFDIKGVTVYRDGCRGGQVLNHLSKKEIAKIKKAESSLTAEDTACAGGTCEL